MSIHIFCQNVLISLPNQYIDRSRLLKPNISFPKKNNKHYLHTYVVQTRKAFLLLLFVGEYTQSFSWYEDKIATLCACICAKNCVETHRIDNIYGHLMQNKGI